MTFNKVSQQLNAYPVFLPVFHKSVPPPVDGISKSRGVLPSDEKGWHGKEHRDFREKGVNVLSTWAWDQASRTAFFWLRGDEMLRMKGE